jgi:hypothetical protein
MELEIKEKNVDCFEEPDEEREEEEEEFELSHYQEIEGYQCGNFEDASKD